MGPRASCCIAAVELNNNFYGSWNQARTKMLAFLKAMMFFPDIRDIWWLCCHQLVFQYDKTSVSFHNTKAQKGFFNNRLLTFHFNVLFSPCWRHDRIKPAREYASFQSYAEKPAPEKV